MESEASNTATQVFHGLKEVITSFQVSMKNYALYPENHTICVKSLQNSADKLNTFLESHDELKLTVKKTGLFFEDQIVHETSTETENLAQVLFRDGIIWFSFSKGMEEGELGFFFRLIKENLVWQEYSDGDLATALWEANLPHLLYEVAEVHWDADTQVNFSDINACPKDDSTSAPPSEKEQQNSLALIIEDSQEDFLALSSEENDRLQRMIDEEEERDVLGDLLFILLVLSKDPSNHLDFRRALEFLEDELKDALSEGDFHYALRFLTGIRHIQQTHKKAVPPDIDEVDPFITKISGPETLDAILSYLKLLDAGDSKKIALLKRFLLLLNPKAVLALGPMLIQIDTPYMKQKLIEIIHTLSTADIKPLIQLLKNRNNTMVRELIPVLALLKGKKSLSMLIKMLSHESAAVRKTVINHLQPIGKRIINELFRLVEDPNEGVCHMALQKLAETRSVEAEKLLLDYLENRKYTIKTHGHLLVCFQALGRCGSSQSIPFLRRSLFQFSLIPSPVKSIMRVGAAVALKHLNIEEADTIVQKASKSLFPSVRMACIKAVRNGK